MTKKKPALPDLTEFCHGVNNLENKTPAELTLLSMAYLDVVLELAIKSRFQTSGEVENKLFGYSAAPLRSLSPKIHVAAALGLIEDRIWVEMQLLRDIRDLYAHALFHPDWDSREVTQKTDQLTVTREYRSTCLPDGATTFFDDRYEKIDDSFGGTIDLSRNDLIIDEDGTIAFFCYGVASDHVTERAKRRYLESYWTCLYTIVGPAIPRWFERVSAASVSS